MFLRREAMLFKNYDYPLVSEEKEITIGLPRTLEFWYSMPFWTTFFHALGFQTKYTHESCRSLYEKGISYIPSDTACFPAKLAHGHIRVLAEQGVDRIFMPMIMEMPPESINKESNYVCALVNGYPLIIHSSDDPERCFLIKFDFPMFHWYTADDRKRLICEYFRKEYGLKTDEINAAFLQGEKALMEFRVGMLKEGQKILENARKRESFAVVLAGRPYHTDSLVSHDLSRIFTKEGIPVLTVDSVPGLDKVNLRYTVAEITNNFHTRMLSGAMLAAQIPEPEYVQIVSFGCGHDAILSDEIVRIMKETSDKSPLILKLGEGDAANSMNIRVKSFLETVSERRSRERELEFRPLGDTYPVKYRKEDQALRTVLIPNVSASFCRLLSAVICRQGVKAEPVPMGGPDEIQPFIDEVIPSEKRDEELMTENMDITIPAEDFFSGNNLVHYYINLLIGQNDSRGIS